MKKIRGDVTDVSALKESLVWGVGGSDLNRHWKQPSSALEPTIYHTLKLLMRLDADPRFSLDCFIDVHSHSNSRSGFLFMDPPSSSLAESPGLQEYLQACPLV